MTCFLPGLLGDVGTIAKIQSVESASSWNIVKPGIFLCSDATYIGIPSEIFGTASIIGIKINGNFAIAFDVESVYHTIAYKRFANWNKW